MGEIVLGCFIALSITLLFYAVIKRADGKYCYFGEKHQFVSFTEYTPKTWGTDKQRSITYCINCGYRKE